MTNSRTSKSIKNAKVALIFYFAQLVLGFFSRKAFFDYLGSEILGLNTTATNLLRFLNLTELGVAAAVGYFLYQPLHDKDYDKLNKLVTIQGWIYRRVAYIIIGVSLILMMFFPVIFSKTPLPLWYAYSTFGVLLFSSLLGYFYNYKQIVLYADQKSYKIQFYVQGTTFVKTIFQILVVSFLSYPFLGWLFLEIVGAIVTTLLLNIVLKKEYIWLRTNIHNGRIYLKEYPEVLKKTKQVFFHRIGTVIEEAAPIIVYGFTNLTTVALYGNYVLIISKVGALLNSVFNSTAAAIGDLVASKDRQRIIRVFWEIYDSRMCISVIFLLCLYHLTNPFISIWLGKEYCLSQTFLLLFIILNSIDMTRTTVDNFLNAFGLYKDVWAPLTEASLNIGFSVLLGYLWGLNGIIIGILISQIAIISLWKPYFLFKEGFHEKAKRFFLPIVYRYSVIVLLFTILHYLYIPIKIDEITNISKIVISFIIVGGSSFVIVSVVSYLLFPGVKDFVIRLKKNKSNE